MQRLYVIADDLTGANDAGAQLSKIGISSTVFLDFKESPIKKTESVVIIDTDSRALNEEAAYDVLYKASRIFHNQGYENVYKKVDSTLRGNVAAELSAVVSVHQPELVVIAPAFPKMNRQTINGHQYVNGELVSETEFGKDPKTPVEESSIPKLLQKHVGKPIVLVDGASLNGNAEELKQNLLENVNQGKKWFVCDAKTDKDLKMIADVFSSISKKTVWAGSAGLIEFLPEALNLKKSTLSDRKALEVNKTLTVSASLSNVTKKQLGEIRSMSDAHMVEVDPVELVKQTYFLQGIVEDCMTHCYKKHLVLFVDSSANNRNATKRLETELSITKNQISEAISKELGKIADAILNSISEISGLILIGGDTAKAICNQLKMNQMELYTELEAGLPLGKLIGETCSRTFWTVTKAGGFGNKHSLKNALNYMCGKE